MHPRYRPQKPFLRGKVYYYKVRDLETGKIFRISTGKTTKKQAEEYLRWHLERLASKDDGTSTRSLEDAINDWLGTKRVRPPTMEGYVCDAKVLKQVLGNPDVHEIDRGDVLRLLSRKRSSRTLRKHLTVLRAVLKEARINGYCEGDPTEGLVIPGGDEKESMALSEDQCRALIGACAPRWLRVLVILGLYTGLRRRNLLGLEWGHVSLRTRTINIPAGEWKGKHAHSIPIHPVLALVLKEQKLRTQHSKVIGKNQKDIRGSFAKAMSDAGLPERQVHTLRHTYATFLMNTGMQERLIQRLMGHYTKSNVTHRYMHPPWGAAGGFDQPPTGSPG